MLSRPTRRGLLPGMATALALLAGCAATPGPQPPVEVAEPERCECPQTPPEEPVCDTVSAPVPEPELPTPVPEPGPGMPEVGNMLVVGQVEYVIIGDNMLQQKARIDTGATTSSVDAHDVTVFERDGVRWARFYIHSRVSDQEYEFESELVRRVRIKSPGEELDRRLVVTLPITLGRVRQMTEVTLTDRDQFEYPVLIGRNFLEGRMVVDVSREYIALDEANQ